MRISYNQFEFINVAVLFSNEGKQLATPVFETFPDDIPLDTERQSVAVKDLKLFAKNVPFAAALKAGAAFGSVYFYPRTNIPRIVFAVAVPLKALVAGAEHMAKGCFNHTLEIR